MKLLQWMFNPRTNSMKIGIGIDDEGHTLVYVPNCPQPIQVTREHPIDISIELASPIPADVPLRLDIHQP